MVNKDFHKVCALFCGSDRPVNYMIRTLIWCTVSRRIVSLRASNTPFVSTIRATASIAASASSSSAAAAAAAATDVHGDPAIEPIISRGVCWRLISFIEHRAMGFFRSSCCGSVCVCVCVLVDGSIYSLCTAMSISQKRSIISLSQYRVPDCLR